MAKNLVLYGLSGFYHCERNKLEDIIPNLDDPELVLLEDGVVGSQQSKTDSPYALLLQKGIKIYAVSEDLQARGIDESSLVSGIGPVDYMGLIDLIEGSERIISWL